MKCTKCGNTPLNLVYCQKLYWKRLYCYECFYEQKEPEPKIKEVRFQKAQIWFWDLVESFK